MVTGHGDARMVTDGEHLPAILAVGLTWLRQALVPGDVILHHLEGATSPVTPEGLSFRFSAGSHPDDCTAVIVVNVANPQYGGTPETTPANPLPEGTMGTLATMLAYELGADVVRTWHGDGFTNGSIGLNERISPSLLAAHARYKQGCTEPGCAQGVFCRDHEIWTRGLLIGARATRIGWPVRVIDRTSYMPRHPWPDDCYLQGGARGAVVGPDGAYRTAFVEAFPAGTFLRGEGATVPEAEDAAWAKYEPLAACPGHGPYEPRGYTNGAGYCINCGGWFPGVLPEQPEHTEKVALINKVFSGDPESLATVLDAVVNVDQLPTREEYDRG